MSNTISSTVRNPRGRKKNTTKKNLNRIQDDCPKQICPPLKNTHIHTDNYCLLIFGEELMPSSHPTGGKLYKYSRVTLEIISFCSLTSGRRTPQQRRIPYSTTLHWSSATSWYVKDFISFYFVQKVTFIGHVSWLKEKGVDI